MLRDKIRLDGDCQVFVRGFRIYDIKRSLLVKMFGVVVSTLEEVESARFGVLAGLDLAFSFAKHEIMFHLSFSLNLLRFLYFIDFDRALLLNSPSLPPLGYLVEFLGETRNV